MDLSLKDKGYPPMNIHKKRKYLLSDNDAIEEYIPEQNEGGKYVSEQNEVERIVNEEAIAFPHTEPAVIRSLPIFESRHESCLSGQVSENERCSPTKVSSESRDFTSSVQDNFPSSLSKQSENPNVTRYDIPVSEEQLLQQGDSKNGIENEEQNPIEIKDRSCDDKHLQEEDHTKDGPISVVAGLEETGDLLDEDEIREYEGIFSDSEEEKESDDNDDGGKEWHTCKLCEKVFFARKTFTKHMRSCHMEKKQNCMFCNKAFSRKTSMTMHMKAVHMNHKPYLCDICGHTFAWAAALTRHMASHSEAKSYSCEECGKTFTNSWNLKSHLLIHNDEKPFPCEECGRKFRRVNALRFHMRIHTNERPHQCDVCSKDFTQPSSLKTHQKMHSGERLHACTVCDERFVRKSDVKSHMRTHTKERPFHCEECNKDFTQASSLKTHMRTHDKNKNHLCCLCGETFALKNTLKVHLMRHKGEKPHKCSVCGKGFTQTSTLKTHMRTHTHGRSLSLCNTIIDNEDSMQEGQSNMQEKEGDNVDKKHRCDLCGTLFALKNTLKIHLMRHKGEKPHQCNVCLKSFTQSSTLKIHMRTHTGDKPYACEICGMPFTYSYSLHKHALTHKGESTEPEEFSEEENDPGVVELTAYDDEDAAANEAALEEMKRKILQTLTRAKAQEEDADDVEEKVSDSNEANKDTVSKEEKPPDPKIVTHLDFLSAFQSTLSAATGDK